MTTADSLPSESSLSEASGIEIQTFEGTNVTFADAALKPSANSTVVVVFVRHFFCGSCQQYMAQLAAIPDSAFQKSNAKIIVVGCGEHSAIAVYNDMLEFSASHIYANPSRNLYRALGMDIETLQGTPKGQVRKSYLEDNLLANALKSIKKGLFSYPSQIGKQGNVSQLGGEFIFKDGQCTFAHRMQHTEDHTEVDELIKQAGITVPSK